MARKQQLTELGQAITAIYPTVILQARESGKFFFSGAIPGACYDHDAGRSMVYDTEQSAIDAALTAGVARLQGVDCRKIVWR